MNSQSGCNLPTKNYIRFNNEPSSFRGAFRFAFTADISLMRLERISIPEFIRSTQPHISWWEILSASPSESTLFFFTISFSLRSCVTFRYKIRFSYRVTLLSVCGNHLSFSTSESIRENERNWHWHGFWHHENGGIMDTCISYYSIYLSTKPHMPLSQIPSNDKMKITAIKTKLHE